MAQSAEMLTKFMKRSQVRRNKKPSRINTSYPSLKPAKGRSDANQRLYRMRPAGPDPVGWGEGRYPSGDPTGFREGAKRPSYGTRAPYTGPTSPHVRKLLRKRRTKPTPGSAYNRQRPTLN